MNILGLKMTSHDTGAALISDGKIVAIGEERLNRIKYSDNIFPERAIEYCLKAQGIAPEKIDHVVTDWIGTEITPTEGEWKNLFLTKTKGRFKNAKLHCINHHDAHAATAFFCSPFEEAAVLVYDGNGATFIKQGIPEVETETVYVGQGTLLEPITKTTHPQLGKHFPYTWGIGKLYSALSRFYLRMGAYNEGKMMGLAAYGDDRILREFPFERWCRWQDGKLICNSDVSYPGSFLHVLRKQSWLHRLLIHARSLWYTKRWFPYDPSFKPIVLPKPLRQKTDVLPDHYYSSIAYAAQHIFERFAMELAGNLRTKVASENLCVAGGCGLNIDANRKFMTEAGFKRVFIQPAASDSGIALGCALWGWHVIAGRPRFFEMKNASLGCSYTTKEIEVALAARKGEVTITKAANIATETAKILAEGNIVGWFQGGSEYGPRALGNRSILCDPRGSTMKETLNVRVKHRENWRPFAASVLRTKMSEWFDMDTESPFMLLMASVHEDKRAIIPAVTHVDGTCRIQSLTKEDNGIYYDVVYEFERLTGTPLLLNTSFNLAGEPIVETPEDALRTFLATDFDYLVLGDRIVTKRTK